MSQTRLQQIEDAEFVEVPEGGAAEGTVFQCALCGARFTHGRQTCGACPLNRGCTLVACPNCGYGFPRESRIVAWWRRLWRGGSS